MPNLTHFDEHGAAVMVDVSGKETTHREALATGIIRVSEAVYAAIEGGTAAKGDVLGVARIAGIRELRPDRTVFVFTSPADAARRAVEPPSAENDPHPYDVEASPVPLDQLAP